MLGCLCREGGCTVFELVSLRIANGGYAALCEAFPGMAAGKSVLLLRSRSGLIAS